MIQFLRGNKSQLEASQTIFGDGQPIFEKDTGQLKVGNGVDVFSSLPYVGTSSSSESSDTWIHGSSASNDWYYKDLSDGHRIMIGSYEFSHSALGEYSNAFNDDFTLGCSPGASINVLWNNADALSMSQIYWANVNITSSATYVDVWVSGMEVSGVSLNIKHGVMYLTDLAEFNPKMMLTANYFCVLS